MKKKASQYEIELYSLLEKLKSKAEYEGVATEGPNKVEKFEPSYQFTIDIGSDDTVDLWVSKDTFETLKSRVKAVG